MSYLQRFTQGLIFGHSVGATLYIGVMCHTWYPLWATVVLTVCYVAQKVYDVGK